jgi:hypothetical protein
MMMYRRLILMINLQVVMMMMKTKQTITKKIKLTNNLNRMLEINKPPIGSLSVSSHIRNDSR